MARLDTVQGTLVDIVYRDEASGYTVICLDTDPPTTVVGTMPTLFPGESLICEGHFETHPVYGLRLLLSSLRVTPLATTKAIEAYLAGSDLPGIGPARARRLVKAFGLKTLDVIVSSPQAVATVPGLSLKNAERMQRALRARHTERDTVMTLLAAGLSLNRARAVCHTLGPDALAKIQRDPWIVMRTVSGIGFQTACRLADGFGLGPTHPLRIRSALWQIIYMKLQNGDTYVPVDEAVATLARLFAIDAHEVQTVTAQGVDDVTLCQVAGVLCYTLSRVDALERHIAKDLARRLGVAHEPFATDAIAAMAASWGMTLSDEQMAAVQMALSHRVSVITGGPGTGKTTIVRTIVALADHAGRSLALTAPTGRAAQRLSDASGHQATTLHRLLGMSADDVALAYEAKTTVDCDLVLVDESSMLDVVLMGRLLASLRRDASLVLVGDVDQLPSVGPGQVLSDVLAVDRVPRTVLSRVYRQSDDHLIVINANRFNHGEPLIHNQTASSPFLIATQDDDEAIAQTVETLLTTKLHVSFGVSDARDVQVLAPMRRGAAGVQALNARLQARLKADRPCGPTLKVGALTFGLGDKVMQTRNRYDLTWVDEATQATGMGVMNGEIGVVMAIDEQARTLEVRFEDTHRVSLEGDALFDLDLAYALTVHKSQGSEYDAVCLAIGHAPPMFLSTNLIYTAMTRAKRRLIIVTRRGTLSGVQRRNVRLTRKTRLARLLNEALEA